MINLESKYIKKGFKWLELNSGYDFLNNDEYCKTRDIFQARLDKFYFDLPKNIDVPVTIAICGEIGNNSFDHNLGKWRDIPGAYFVHDVGNKCVILADRGQGIKKTLEKVIPEIKDDLDALKIAFLKNISGRAPEKRGNGLKLVLAGLKENNMEMNFYSGNAVLEFYNKKENFKSFDREILGCLAIIKYEA